MSKTQKDLDRRVECIAREVEDIARGKRWRRSSSNTDDTTIYTAKKMIAEVIDSMEADEFFDAIEPAIREAEALTAWIDERTQHPQGSDALTEQQKEEFAQEVLAYLKTLDEDSIEDDQFLSEVLELLTEADEIEQARLDDYFDGHLGVEFCVDQNLDLRSVEVCVACGGPAIYVCSNRGVWGIWWSDKAEQHLPLDVMKAIDEWGEHEFEIVQAYAEGKQRRARGW
jgi:hypothetical protein